MDDREAALIVERWNDYSNPQGFMPSMAFQASAFIHRRVLSLYSPPRSFTRIRLPPSEVGGGPAHRLSSSSPDARGAL